MALSIKSEEADRLAREVSARTGESLTDAVVRALRERLDRLQADSGPGLADRIRRIQREVADLPVLDGRPTDEIMGYDEHGLPA